MLKFIQSSIKDRGLLDDNTSSSQGDDSSAILEFAKVFQELDDLSMGGTNDPGNTRKIGSIDIPIDEDVEAEVIEFNLSDGRINDVPGDASVMESNYSTMKSYEDFWQEAADTIGRFPRESNDSFEKRVRAKADKMYNEYCNHVIQEGLFGFGMININDSRVPANVMVDFGYVDNGKVKMPYIVKMPVFFQTDNKHRIHKKQLDSINQSVERNVWGGSFPDMVLDYLQKNYPDDVKNVTDIWQVVTPKRLLVPVDPMDSFVVLLEVEYDFDDKPDYWKWSSKINGGSKKSFINSSDTGFTNDSDIAASLSGFRSKKDVIKESFELKRPNRFGSVVQEAIDFGEGDNTNSDTNTPPSSDNMSVDSNPNVSVDGDSTQSVDNQLNGTNDVSNDIANKVSEELANAENNNNPTDVQSDDLSVSNEPDLPTDDSALEEPTSDNTNIDQQIDDLGNGTDDGVSSNIDVDNMTLDELIEQGTQRLKGMTLAQIKDFLNGGENASIDGIDEPNETIEGLQEAFINGTDEDIFQEMMILTKNNVNRTIDISLRNALGILNDNEKDVNTIITEFKKEGKKLNKILSKAAKMKKVYDDNERSEIASLNKCLVDLMAVMKTSDMKSDAATVKRMIKAFAAQAAVVAKIVEGKNGGKDNG